MVWLFYLICAGLIFFSGSRLSFYGDIIAEKSGLGRTLIGSTLVASVTSLPELMTSISAVYFHNLPDISLANILGASCYNLLLFALLDSLITSVPLSSKINKTHTISCVFAIILTNLIIFGLTFNKLNHIGLHIGWNTILIILVYFISLNLLLKTESNLKENSNDDTKYSNISLTKALFYYFLNSIIVISAAFYLPLIGDKIASITGLSKTLIGNIFLSISTSLPEIVVSYTSIKRGYFDLAVGNIFGSVLFNTFILSIADLLYFKGPILSFVEPNHILTSLALNMMLCVATISIMQSNTRKRFLLSPSSIVIISIFLLNWFLLYKFR